MGAGDYIAITSVAVTVIIAIIGGVYAVATNSKKYELAEQYKCEMLAWYEKVVMTIMRLTASQSAGNGAERENISTELAELSALIEISRFFFPNIDKQDGHGSEKPRAYRGYRHMALDFLVYIYQIGLKGNSSDYKKQVRDCQP